MSEVGALIIKLQAETASFREDMGKVKGDLDDLKDKAGDAGEGFDSSMKSARGSLMMVEESVGVRLPRHLNTLIAEIPGVGAAFAMMLPIAGVVLAGELIHKLVEGHKSLEDSIHGNSAGWRELTEQSEKFHLSAEAAILGLKAHLEELTSGPLASFGTRLKEIDAQSMKQLRSEFDELGKTAEKNFLSMEESWLKSTLFGDGNAQSEIKNLHEQFTLLGQAIKVPGTSLTQINRLIQEQIDKTTEAMHTNEEWAHTAKTDDIIAAQQRLLAVLGDMKQAYNDVAAENQLKKQVVTQEQVNKTTEAGAALQHILTAGVHAHDEALKKLAETNAEASTGGKSAQNDSAINDHLAKELTAIETARVASTNAAAANLAAQRKQYDADIVAAGENIEKKKELSAHFVNEMRAASDAIIQADAEANKKSEAAMAAACEKKIQLAEKLAQAVTQVSIAGAKQEESFHMSAIKAEEARNNAASALGLETQRRYLAQKIALIKEEEKAKEDALAAEIEAERKAAAAAHAAGDPAKENAALARKIQLQTQLNSVTTQYATEVKGLQTDLAKLNSSWSTYFAKMKTETQDLSTQIRTNLQASVTRFTQSFGDSMAKCIVEGKSLGQAVKQEAEQMLESMISMLVQWLEKWIISHTIAKLFQQTSDESGQASAASLAGANMVASWSAAPWPIDGMAPAMGMQAYAAAMSFEVGGKIPGEGPVPIVGHGGETVVTKALTDKVEAANGRGTSAGGGNHTWNYAPQIHAVDATGVDAMLTKHASLFQRHITNTMRKMNR
jgi:hypothetical protein